METTNTTMVIADLSAVESKAFKRLMRRPRAKYKLVGVQTGRLTSRRSNLFELPERKP